MSNENKENVQLEFELDIEKQTKTAYFILQNHDVVLRINRWIL